MLKHGLLRLATQATAALVLAGCGAQPYPEPSQTPPPQPPPSELMGGPIATAPPPAEAAPPPPQAASPPQAGPVQNPAPGPKPAPVRAAVASKSLRVKDHRVAVVVSCPAAAKATCRGAIRLQTATKIKLKGHKRKAIVTLASRGSYAAKPGHKATVELKLTKAARTVARHGRSVKVSVLLTPTGARQPAVTARLTLKG